MTLLAPEADRAVREAVDAFMAGQPRPPMFGETTFETRNSRYRLMDGVLFSSTDTSMIGAELVGWLLEGPEQSVVQDGWIIGARGVLVDRNKNRNIIVTSTTRVFRVADGSGLKPAPHAPAMPAGSSANHQVGSSAARPNDGRPYLPAAVPPTPTPALRLIPACPPAPIGRLPGTTELSVATAMLTRDAGQPGSAPPLPPPNPPVRRTAAPIHAPPRLTGKHPRTSIPALSPPPGMRPLPYPAPPPRAAAPQASVQPIQVEPDPTVTHDRSSLPLPPASTARPGPASGPRRGSGERMGALPIPSAPPRAGSRRAITAS